MALLEDWYLFVKEESVSSDIEVSEHPVEKGLDITDNVKKNPLTISLSGEIVGKNAAKKVKKIRTCHRKGKFVTYIGKTILKNAIITKFDVSYTNTIWGGCNFDMELKQIRLAESPYKKKTKKKTASKKKSGTKQIITLKTGKIYHTVKKGETALSIARQYRSQGCTVSFLMNHNSHVPKVKGDWRTLPIGAKVWVNTRK